MLFFKEVKAHSNESLILIRKGKYTNLGIGVSCKVFRNDNYAIVPVTNVQTDFQMEQQSLDGITLKFKGIVVFRIVKPESACLNFNFAAESGIQDVSQTIRNLCLGNLRTIVAKLNMNDCIEKREILSEKLKDMTLPIVEGESMDWGVKIITIQVAQVFITSDELYGEIQSVARDEFRKKDQISKIMTKKMIDIAGLDSDKEITINSYALEKEKIEQKRKSLELNRKYEEEKINHEAEIQMLNIKRQMEVKEKLLELKKLESQINEIEVRDSVLKEQSMLSIQKELLPIQQMPEISKNLGNLFTNSKLSFYGDSHVSDILMDLIGSVTEKIKNTDSKEKL